MDSAIVWTATAVGLSGVLASVFNWAVKRRVNRFLSEGASESPLVGPSNDSWTSPIGKEESPDAKSRVPKTTQQLLRFGPDPSTSVEIRPAEATAAQLGLRFDRETLTRWSPFLSAVIDVARTAAITRSDLYALTFSKAALAGLADGTFTAVGAPDGVRSWIVDAHTGRFVEHGVLHSATLIKAAAVAGTAWRVLAVVTAQKFLADINRQLASMKVALEEIHQHLEQDRTGKLVGNLVYLRGNAELIAAGQISEREVQSLALQIEAIDRESIQVIAAFEGTLNVQLTRLTALGDDGKRLSLPNAEQWDQIEIGICRTEQYLQALTASTLARLIANEQSLMLDPDGRLSACRRDNLDQAIRTVEDFRDAAHQRVISKLEQIQEEIEHQQVGDAWRTAEGICLPA